MCKAYLPGQKEEEERAWSDDGGVLWIRGEGKDEKLNRIRLIHGTVRSLSKFLRTFALLDMTFR